MNTKDNLRESILECAKKKNLFLPHAVRQMSHPERMISTKDVREVIEHGEIIEDYPEDVRGHSCLFLGKGVDERLCMLYVHQKKNILL